MPFSSLLWAVPAAARPRFASGRANSARFDTTQEARSLGRDRPDRPQAEPPSCMQQHNEHHSGPSCWPLGPGLILNAPAYLHRLGPGPGPVQTWQLLARQTRWLPEESHHSSSTDLPAVEPPQQERTSSQSSAMHRQHAPPRTADEAERPLSEPPRLPSRTLGVHYLASSSVVKGGRACIQAVSPYIE